MVHQSQERPAMRTRTSYLLGVAAALALLGSASLPSAIAQQPGGQTLQGDELHIEGVKEQRKRVEESPDLGEGLKTRLLELYTRAVEDLERATPVAEVVPDAPLDASVAQLEQLLS